MRSNKVDTWLQSLLSVEHFQRKYLFSEITVTLNIKEITRRLAEEKPGTSDL